MSERFVLKRYEITVGHWGKNIYLAKTRGKALADAWRSDAFNGYTFGEFLKMARCRVSDYQPVPGEGAPQPTDMLEVA